MKILYCLRGALPKFVQLSYNICMILGKIELYMIGTPSVNDA